MVLTKNEIENITNHYASWYDIWENLVDLEEIVERHGNNPFFIYRKHSQIKNFLVLCENKKITIEIPSKKEDIMTL